MEVELPSDHFDYVIFPTTPVRLSLGLVKWCKQHEYIFQKSFIIMALNEECELSTL